MSSDDYLSDMAAKKIMRQWPNYTNTLFGGTDAHPWLKSQPKMKGGRATTPIIMTAGATALKTQPDGMYIRPLWDFRALDVICFEVCLSLPNLQDKRSRYNATTASLVVEAKASWWNEAIHGSVTRHGKVGEDYEVTEDEWYPIRYLRVAFVLGKDHLETFRENGVAQGHEFFLRNRSLASMTNQKFRSFLEQMSPFKHFYTQ